MKSDTKINLRIVGEAFLVLVMIFVLRHLLPPMTYYTGGLLMIGMGMLSVILQFLVSKDRPRSKLKWSGKEQKAAMLIIGLGLVAIGIVIVLFFPFGANGGPQIH